MNRKIILSLGKDPGRLLSVMIEKENKDRKLLATVEMKMLNYDYHVEVPPDF